MGSNYAERAGDLAFPPPQPVDVAVGWWVAEYAWGWLGGRASYGPVAGADGWVWRSSRWYAFAYGVECVWVAGFSDAVVGDGLRAWFSGGCCGGGWGSAGDAGGADDAVDGADRDCSDVGGAGCRSDTDYAAGSCFGARACAGGGHAGGWFDVVWFGVASAGRTGGFAGGFAACRAIGSCRGRRWVTRGGGGVDAGGGAA